MWPLLTALYLAGLLGTAVMLRRDRTVEAGRVVEATCSVLWPLYWSILYFCSVRNRRRTP